MISNDGGLGYVAGASLELVPGVFASVENGRTMPGGELFIGGIAPGVHTVTLDPENLPIELVPERLSVVAEVAAGALTRVDFAVRPKFGIAGRVADGAGQDIAGRRVEISGATGTLGRQGVTDRVGLFRIDGLPPGDYRVRLLPESGDDGPMPVRSAHIENDFLFDQDLILR